MQLAFDSPKRQKECGQALLPIYNRPNVSTRVVGVGFFNADDGPKELAAIGIWLAVDLFRQFS